MAPSGRRHWTRLTNGPPPRPDCSSPAAGTSKAAFLVTRSGRSVVVTADAFPLLRHCEELGQRFQLPTPREPPVAAGHIVVIEPVGRERFGRSVPSSRIVGSAGSMASTELSVMACCLVLDSGCRCRRGGCR